MTFRVETRGFRCLHLSDRSAIPQARMHSDGGSCPKIRSADDSVSRDFGTVRFGRPDFACYAGLFARATRRIGRVSFEIQGSAFISLGAFVTTAAFAIGVSRLAPSNASALTVADAAQASQSPAARNRPARAGYRVIGVGDIMMGSDWPTPIMDARVTPDGRSRRPCSGRRSPRCSAPATSSSAISKARSTPAATMPRPAAIRASASPSAARLSMPNICAAPASPSSPTPTITAAISARPGARATYRT